jgi:hypothetical protein
METTMLKVKDLLDGIETSAYVHFPVDCERYELAVWMSRTLGSFDRCGFNHDGQISFQYEIFGPDERAYAWLARMSEKVWRVANTMERADYSLSNSRDVYPSSLVKLEVDFERSSDVESGFGWLYGHSGGFVIRGLSVNGFETLFFHALSRKLACGVALEFQQSLKR